jgi:hypothetical protein
MLFNVPVAVNGGGYAAPAAFLLATIALTIFTVGYIAMCGRATSAAASTPSSRAGSVASSASARACSSRSAT